MLEEANLRKLPEAVVVVVGGKQGVEKVLLHHTFRNTIHALYVALPDATAASKATLSEPLIITTRVNKGLQVTSGNFPDKQMTPRC